MNAKTIFAAGSIAVAALVTFPAHADPEPPADGCHPWHHAMKMRAPLGIGLAERMADRLNLSNEQIASLRAIEDKYRPGLRSAVDRLRDSRRALAQIDPADAGKLRAIADARGKAIADMIVMRTQMRAEVRAVLTQEQGERMQEMHHRGPHGGWRGERHGQTSEDGGQQEDGDQPNDEG
jgi:Spy/CpxP family protein refolding chaperone